MFESHFGLSAPPFQLSPDPAMFFESHGHARALSYLKFGVYQGEGFIAITGEIGAGKTTLVQALLRRLDPACVVSAEIVSTQLGADDLLRAISHAFGIQDNGASKSLLIDGLKSFFTMVATSGRRCLLVVDEAQHLSLDALEELRMLSNFQIGNQPLLQSFLVGQPDLRFKLQARAAEQFRQRIVAAYHLGPLSGEETRTYIEHRLQRVGWRGAPSFDDEALAKIFSFTGGIPRKINLLCTRLLLNACLSSLDTIDAAQVTETGSELRWELGLAAAA